MKIKWFGHASFIITSRTGTKIVTNPYDEMLRFHLQDPAVRIVTASNGRRWDDGGALRGSFRHIGAPGLYIVDGIAVKGVDTYDGSEPAADINIAYNMRIDGISVCHCGELEHPLSVAHINAIGKVDVLLLPVGGGFTLDPGGASVVVSQLRPTVVIPMHYNAGAYGMQGPVSGKVGSLVSASAMTARPYDIFDIEPATIKECAGIAVLKYYWS